MKGFRFLDFLTEGEFDVAFFGLSALSFGIGPKQSFYYKIDTPLDGGLKKRYLSKIVLKMF